MPTDTDGPHAIAWIREPSASSAAAPEPRLDGVKAALRNALPAENIFTAAATKGANDNLDDAYLDAFATTIRAKLEAAIDRHIAEGELEQSGPYAELWAERAAHRAFAVERRNIVGRESNIPAIARYIAGNSMHRSSCPAAPARASRHCWRASSPAPRTARRCFCWATFCVRPRMPE
jgi:hypothetical protein